MTRGPMTMYGVGRDRPNYIDEIPDDEAVVILAWGEVDCRCFIHDHQPAMEEIERVVAAYLDAVRAMQRPGISIMLFNIVPPPKSENCFETYDGKGFPFVGSNEQRLSYVKKMNEELKKSEFPVIDVYDHYADEEGFMRDGNVHVTEPAPLIEWMENALKEGILK